MLDENIEESTSEESIDKIEKASKKTEKTQAVIDKDIEDEKSIEKIDEVVTTESKDAVDNKKTEKEDDVKEVVVKPVVDSNGENKEFEIKEEKIVAEQSETTDVVKKKQEIEMNADTDEKEPVELIVDAKDEKKINTPIEKKQDESVVSDPETAPKKVPVIDVSKLTLDGLVDAMQKLNEFPIQETKKQFENLRSDFTKKFNVFIAEKKEAFIKDGGNEIDFSFFLPVKTTFNEVVQSYKRKRQKHYKEIESEQKENLQKKLQLIEDLKNLIDNADPSSMYKNFRSLQDEWRKIGQIPHSKYNDVWRTYDHHVERFYDLLHLNNDLRDLDFKHNLEEKTKLVEKVEQLADQENINHAFKELQILHRMWKEDIGPVARDVREEIWDRFSEATKKIHDKRHEFQNQLDSKFKANVDLKIAVIEKIKEFKIDNETSHKAWQEGIRKMEKLRNEFFAIGRVPKSKNEEVWQLFKEATRKFNKSKNTFYKDIKKDQLENLEKKMNLVEQAESLKDSEDWDSVTEVFKKIQSNWRKIGHVPRKDSDKIWKRFKDACNHYFDQLHNMQDGSNKEQVEVFNKKKELLDLFKEEIAQEVDLTLDLINSRITDWKKLGVVPVKMRHIDSKFNKAIDLACKKINIDKDEATLLKFKNVIDAFVDQNDVRKIDNEQLFVRRKVDELTKEIKLLENNISFISNASRDNPLIANVYKNIDKHNEDLKIWQKKLSYLRKLEY